MLHSLLSRNVEQALKAPSLQRMLCQARPGQENAFSSDEEQKLLMQINLSPEEAFRKLLKLLWQSDVSCHRALSCWPGSGCREQCGSNVRSGRSQWERETLSDYE